MSLGGVAVMSLTMIGSPVAAAETAPPSGKVEVEVVTVNGSGCPSGTTAVTQKPDNTGFTVNYKGFMAEAGAGAEPTDFRKNCQISLLVHVPQGFTYAIARADYRGYAQLGPGASGLQQASYYFQGESQTTTVPHAIRGPFSGYWQNTDITDSASLVYAPCGITRGLNINTELRVHAGDSGSNSFMTMNSTRGGVQTLYQYQWKSCP
jgi:hypothetical protein